ncbi:1-acyl-sn-glycerol-3-phosphate acyltransferase [Deinococcus metallilatus]|uniref:1-acyl-sn-glycerol-3-phosphate acyltransferase n=1 Tax=Deinococcus metallilatus TaxID=1211322 RepID=A0AAJ5F4U0_9DEIO|nr:lysophospholipid acyltransferase family protein [Deinococcus metallilatus]MBB5294643.1 1-acyl-sn-glycerol-3-phosphate acyltransferase [Deinococcus metallilatus]QBY07679.1 1-acyl-sn-glycerol-3-phosphate acyltransferase [Deinococcus metallilatus]RXJ14095.1 1-acyl-sn-glycerol-3-phosphate acyltransferase [Deinococcus metallilatus]TLK30060.1 1-acyl-sn-glycerol-3-phosphate acyltransferase [Deinococcus metallilatus]GMA15856.1 1-acyl-sn-glycerol-3-phosphate acyltransferase [Deinococcus metallilatus
MSGADPVGVLLRASIRHSIRTHLGGVWVRGPLPHGGAVLAANHHSWWDGYVLGEVAATLGADFRVLMTARQLARFPFLRRVGVLGVEEVRPAVRAARAGAWVVVFPEGAIRPAGVLRQVKPGAAWIARTAGVPLVPVALRVVLRGGQYPEAYLRFGRAVGAPDLVAALSRELAALEADLAGSDPEQPLAGYLRLTAGRASDHERLDWPSRALARLTGDR